ncbi:lolal-like protein [Daphnia pulex]|uniref:Lolal-like protein n=1 Tax=Daphnia pulex TaxID=6669 RepID=E9G218_DAPPU|nr:lolal-like protein [Daphnia pulex]|eukprot:EFX86384.1 lolal-like protein [Daphnia pulex]
MDNQVCLRWNNFQSSLTTTLEILWDEESFCDVTLFCGGQEIRAHKVVLSACSMIFKSLLKNNTCQHPIIILHDISLNILEAILQFIYKGEVNIEQDQLNNLLRAATLLQIRGLAGIAENEVDLENQLLSKPMKTGLSQNFPSSDFSPVKRKKPKVSSSPKENDDEPLLVTSKEEPLSEEETCGSAIYTDEVYERPDSLVLLDRKEEDECSHGVIDVDPLVTKPTNIPLAVNSSDEMISNSSQAVACNNTQFPPYPCPFCCRAYATWGFRRRHIKAIHTTSPKLPCKWCSTVMASRGDWENHVIDEHHLSRSEAEQGLKVLEEAHMVLQTTNIADDVLKETADRSFRSKDKK